MRAVCLAAVCAVLALSACGGGDISEGDRIPAATRVEASPVRVEEIVEPILGTGSVAAEKTTEIGPRVDGIIDEIYVKVGDPVEAGQPLFRTRPVDYEIGARQAQHALALARAELRKAERDLHRAAELRDSNVVSEDRLDAVRTAHEIARARAAEAATVLERARQNLADTVVTAPYAGVITARYVDEGAMQRTMMSANAVVVQLMKTDRVVAIVEVPATHLARVHVGTAASVKIDGLPGTFEGTVFVLNDRVGARTRAFEVRIPVENSDRAIKPGLFARAQLWPEPREALVVERRAVLGAEGDRYVFVEQDGHAVRRPLHVRDLDALRLEVLDGLGPGDEILAGPAVAALREGDAVMVDAHHADR
ncbi:MAG: efflux RND transporter periplasmic adaptor subunit [Myxococcota bacterium]